MREQSGATIQSLSGHESHTHLWLPVAKRKLKLTGLRYIKDWVCKYLIQKVMRVVYLRKETCDKYETWPWPLSC